MPRICYVPKNFQPQTAAVIDQANEIIAEYQAQGFDLTLRQLYYQFVSRDMLENTQQSYSRLGSVINDARLAGLIDWYAIVDRTRNLASLAHWVSAAEILEQDAECFRYDRWASQNTRVQVWIEKEALAGVFERVCESWDVPYFACRGYVSQSEMWTAAQRFRGYESQGQDTLILHFGDHDPSGMDMTRDIKDRLALFGSRVEVKRIALNMNQVEQYNPPPNPAKITDSRAAEYIASYGNKSWELDALDPATLAALVENELEKLLEQDAWDEEQEREDETRATLAGVAENWGTISENY